MKNMKTVNSLSGGKTSSYMAVHYPADINVFACVCIDYPAAKPKDQAVLKYCLDKLEGNFIASAEHEKTLKVMMQLEQMIGKEIVWVRGKSFDEIIDGAGCLPTWNRRFCTTDMKILPIFEYVYFNHGFVKEQIGFRYDELHRAYGFEEIETEDIQTDLFGNEVVTLIKTKKLAKKVKAIMADYPLSCKNFGKRKQNLTKEIHWANKDYPLIDNKVFHKVIIDYWKDKSGFDFPLDSNCRGCHHKPPTLIKQNWEETPEIMEWFSLQEQKGKYNTWHDDVIPYREKFKMKFTELINYDYSFCNSGGCTD